LPADFDEWVNVTYVEPFVGGGSMLLHMLNKYSNITRAVINDINPVLMKSYLAIKNDPSSLIEDLKELKREYIRLEIGTLRDDFFYNTRKEYNEMDLANEKKIALFIFLNHTCFNGLYRENRMGLFNVPHGKYKNPVVFEESNLLALHDILKKLTSNAGILRTY
jgi:modification methylase mjaIII